MTILSLAVLVMTNGGWADHPEPVARVSWATSPFERKTLPVSLRTEDDPPARKPAPQTPPKPTAAPPRLWQLKDRSGRTWQHTDPRWLQTYVGRVNAAMATQYTAPVLQYGSPCANGACQR